MRNLSLLFLLTIFACQSSKTSTTITPADSKSVAKVTTKGNPFYKPFSEFKGDTLQYLNYNFVEHKDQYIGNPFSVLYHDLEIPVKSSIGGYDQRDILISPSISLSFYDDNTARYRMNSDAGPLYIVIVTWEKRVSREAYSKLYEASNVNWNSSYEALFAGQIVKNVDVSKHANRKFKKK